MLSRNNSTASCGIAIYIKAATFDNLARRDTYPDLINSQCLSVTFHSFCFFSHLLETRDGNRRSGRAVQFSLMSFVKGLTLLGPVYLHPSISISHSQWPKHATVPR